jgi:hypothetical protein
MSAAAVEPHDCAFLLDKQLGGWSLPTVDPDVLYSVTRSGRNPFVTTGDFDDDQEDDVAFLILKDGETGIAVCLSGKPDVALIIGDLYCDDGIVRIPKGTTYHNYETDSEGRHDRDGVHAYCYERAGATYLYTGGSFKRVIDSD